LCDGAYNYNGKITVVGTTDNIKVFKFPSKLTIGLAIKISFSPEEYGEKRVSLRILSPSSIDTIPPINLPPTDSRGKDGEEARVVIAGNLQDVNIEEEGLYTVLLIVNGTEFSLPFKVFK
jgi:hypothetical protein